MWEARADRMLFPGICHSLRGDFSWPKMGILKWPLTLCFAYQSQTSGSRTRNVGLELEIGNSELAALPILHVETSDKQALVRLGRRVARIDFFILDALSYLTGSSLNCCLKLQYLDAWIASLTSAQVGVFQAWSISLGI
jgi:hypothetical protein